MGDGDSLYRVPTAMATKATVRGGERPMEYLTNQRLFKASQMLKPTGAATGQVARNCGFSSRSYFARRFRERYGHTPSEHRNAG